MSKARQAPSIYTLENLRSSRIMEVTRQAQDPNDPTKKRFVPARPMGLDSFRHRLRCAIMVFKGKADLVIWPDGQ